MKAALDRAIAAAGSLSELAERLCVSPQVISNWRVRGIPAARVLAIEGATRDGAGRPSVTRHELRPDLYPEAERVA